MILLLVFLFLLFVSIILYSCLDVMAEIVRMCDVSSSEVVSMEFGVKNQTVSSGGRIKEFMAETEASSTYFSVAVKNSVNVGDVVHRLTGSNIAVKASSSLVLPTVT